MMKPFMAIFLCAIGAAVFNIASVRYFFGFGSMVIYWLCLAVIIIISFLKISRHESL